MGTSALPATAPHLPIWRDAQRLLVWAEQAVRGFARYHKYTVGTQIRQQALLVCRGVLRSQAQTGRERLAGVTDLHLAAEELKLLLQLAKEVRAFRSWAEFEQGVDLALAVARQAAGWRKALQSAQANRFGAGREGTTTGATQRAEGVQHV